LKDSTKHLDPGLWC